MIDADNEFGGRAHSSPGWRPAGEAFVYGVCLLVMALILQRDPTQGRFSLLDPWSDFFLVFVLGLLTVPSFLSFQWALGLWRLGKGLRLTRSALVFAASLLAAAVVWNWVSLCVFALDASLGPN